MSVMKQLFALLAATLLMSNAVLAESKHTRINKNLTIYTDVFRQLDMHYVDTLNYEELTRASINAMLKTVDPYTVYIPKSETDDLMFMTTGAYGGIGAVISNRNGRVQIADPYEGMPAQVNDVRAGDYILSVDGKSTKGMNVSEVSALLKGKPHEKIRLTLEREGEKKPIKKEFERKEIQIHPVGYYSFIEKNVGYIQLNEFTDKAASEVKGALKALEQQDSIHTLALDLRDNGGGIIDEAVKILALFLPKGTEVVSTRGRNGEVTRRYKTTTEPLYPNMKLYVLTSRVSASASEIVAGALQDLDAATLIGERTFGKGLVQSIRPMSYDGHLKVTTAKYYIPSGRCIQAIDYKHGAGDRHARRIPDSLTTEFKTKKGRIVRDGGGVSPDIEITEKEELNIVYYLFMEHKFFDFATRYKMQHASIAPAGEFEVSDALLAEFEQYLTDEKFTYTSETEKQFAQLLEVAGYEGLDSIAKVEFDALREKLKPDISRSIAMNKEKIKQFLGTEIVKRYYFQKGETEFLLRDDKFLKEVCK